MNNLKWFGVHRTRLEWGPDSPFIVRSLEIPTDSNSTQGFCPNTFFHRTQLTLIPFHIASTRVKMQTKQLLMVMKLQGRNCRVLICLLLPNFKHSLCLLM